MNPDMDRLVAAAENAYQDARLPNEVLSQRTTQAIVRAVLLALRESSNDAIYEGASELSAYELEFNGIGITMRTALAAMIDHILAEPSTA